MIAERDNLTPAEIRERAEAWFNREVERLKKVHGDGWESRREFLEGYLREEIRERLVVRGWRPKK